MDVYDRYKFCVEDSMDIGQLLKFMEMEEPVYFLFKKNNEVGNEITVCEKVIINDIRDVENSFSSEMTDKSLTLYFLSGKYSERNKIIRFSGNGKHFIFLKNKPGERFVKISIDNMVQQGLYCGECKYCRNEKIFCDELSKHHDGSCFLFLTYLEFDKEIGEMIKCEQCKVISG